MKNEILTVIIPARNEKYLQKTIENVLENAEEEIEIIAILDGYWADPPIQDHPSVRIIHNTVARGQRPSINDAAKIARGKYIMKLDGHCAVGKGFDVILKRDCEYDMTMIPEMRNLDVTTWKPKDFDDYRTAVRRGKVNPYMYIGKKDGRLRTLYYSNKIKKEMDLNRKDIMIDETMSCMGCCFFMHKDRFWELDGCDEAHGHWGQQGIEVACKAWLSGGRLMVNKNTWFAHWFRGGGVPKGEQKGAPWEGFTQKLVDNARDYSEDLWLNNKWDKQVRDFQWLIKKFNPPTWTETTIIYYTDGTIEEPIKSKVINNIKEMDIPTVLVSNDGKERSHLQLFKNIKKGLANVETKYVALAEHDCLYPKEHFEFIPPKDDTFYYNTNHYFAVMRHSQYHKPYKERKALSGTVCNKELLEKAVDERIKFLENGGELIRGVSGACEFGIRDDDYKAEGFKTKIPYLDIRHGNNFSGYRKGKERLSKLDYWGDFSELFGKKLPPGKWYQEATINGQKVPTRRKSDTNQKRWENFIKPFVEKGTGRFTDLGCNAGFYCRKMADLGYLSEGVEIEQEFIDHNRYWEEQDPKGVRLVECDINDYEVWASKYTLLANIHYWLTPEQNEALEKQLREKSLNVIVIGRYKTLKRHKSPCDMKYLKELFKDWDIGGIQEHKKHFSILFKNKYLVEKDVSELTHYQQFMKSKKFLPAYTDFINKVLAGEKFDKSKSDYAEYLRWRKFKNKKTLLKRHTDLIFDMKENGIKNPLLVGRIIDGELDKNRLKDGDHRLIVAKCLGINKIICKKYV